MAAPDPKKFSLTGTRWSQSSTGKAGLGPPRASPAPTAPGRRDQRGVEPFRLHSSAGGRAEHVLGPASKQTSKRPCETPDVVSQIKFG